MIQEVSVFHHSVCSVCQEWPPYWPWPLWWWEPGHHCPTPTASLRPSMFTWESASVSSLERSSSTPWPTSAPSLTSTHTCSWWDPPGYTVLLLIVVVTVIVFIMVLIVIVLVTVIMPSWALQGELNKCYNLSDLDESCFQFKTDSFFVSLSPAVRPPHARPRRRNERHHHHHLQSQQAEETEEGGRRDSCPGPHLPRTHCQPVQPLGQRA